MNYSITEYTLGNTSKILSGTDTLRFESKKNVIVATIQRIYFNGAETAVLWSEQDP